MGRYASQTCVYGILAPGDQENRCVSVGTSFVGRSNLDRARELLVPWNDCDGIRVGGITYLDSCPWTLKLLALHVHFVWGAWARHRVGLPPPIRDTQFSDG